jgi:hypothetical protein
VPILVASTLARSSPVMRSSAPPPGRCGRFRGDTWAFDRMSRLARAATPLRNAAPVIDRHTPLRLTDAGRRVLAGEADHVELGGVDRWIGGVHLTGRAVTWRWNEATEAVTGG